MKYKDLVFMIPHESKFYKEDSEYVIQQIIKILDTRKKIGDNKIIINTNLKMGLPLENINKIAGPMIEAWAGEVFAGIRDDYDNEYNHVVPYTSPSDATAPDRCFVPSVSEDHHRRKVLQDTSLWGQSREA